MSTLTQVTQNALALSPDDRAMLLHRLYESSEHFATPEIEVAWMEEADRRWREIEEGKAECLSAEEVMKRARQALGKAPQRQECRRILSP